MGIQTVFTPTPSPKFQALGTRGQGTDGGMKITGKKVVERDLVNFLQAQIRTYEAEARKYEPEWDRACRAYRGDDPGRVSPDEWTTGIGDEMMIGIPTAATETAVAALVARNPEFVARPKTEQARALANLCQVLLSSDHVWDKQKRQWQMEKLVKSAKHYGLMIGKVHYETDYDAFQKRMEEEKAAAEEALARPLEDRRFDSLIDLAIDEELHEMDRLHSKVLSGEPDHSIPMKSVGMVILNPRDYVADPNAESFVWGPRWEGRRLKKAIKDVRLDERYRKSARDMVEPTHIRREGIQNPWTDRQTRLDSVWRQALPKDYQFTELFEIYWYDDPEFKESYGSLITISLDQGLLLERRPNPYGRRPYVVEEWKADIGELFPQPDINGWFDLWRGYREVVYRLLRQLRKAPNSTLLVRADSNLNVDALQGLLDNDDGGVAPVDIDSDKPFQQEIHELATRQVSPEYINAANALLQIIQMVEGFGPNQFAGGALKSETSATEAGEIGRFARARLDVKGNALQRFMARMGQNVLSAIFRFKRTPEILDYVDRELLDELEITPDAIAAAKFEDIAIDIEPRSTQPDSDAVKLQKVQFALQANAGDPILNQRCDRDTLIKLLNEVMRLPTGKALYMAMQEAGVDANAVALALQGGGGSQPRAAGQGGGGASPIGGLNA